MKTPSPICILVVLGALMISRSPALGDVREFKDTSGKIIEAELVAVRGDQVTLRMKTGKEFTLPVARFSEGDVAFIQDWGAKNPAPVNLRGVLIEFKKNMDKLADEKPSDGGKGKKGPAPDRMQIDFNITVRNTSNDTVENLKLDYTIYKEVTHRVLGRGGSNSETMEETSGSESIGVLGSSASRTLLTSAVILSEFEKKEKGSDQTERHGETLWGIVARLSQNGQEVLVDEYPDGLLSRLKAQQREDR